MQAARSKLQACLGLEELSLILKDVRGSPSDANVKRASKRAEVGPQEEPALQLLEQLLLGDATEKNAALGTFGKAVEGGENAPEGHLPALRALAELIKRL